MRKRLAVAALLAVLASGTALAAAAINLDDFDGDVMQAMDDAFKDLDPVIGARDIKAAEHDVAVLLEGYQFTEDYFVQKGGPDDAIQWSREGRQLVQQVSEALARGDLEAASTTARATQKNCKVCHDAYKTRQ